MLTPLPCRRMYLKQYDAAQTEEARKKVLLRLNKRLLKINFEH